MDGSLVLLRSTVLAMNLVGLLEIEILIFELVIDESPTEVRSNLPQLMFIEIDIVTTSICRSSLPISIDQYEQPFHNVDRPLSANIKDRKNIYHKPTARDLILN
jgi:hypothetical protein